MYGIVNIALKDFVLDSFGAEKWDIIREKSGVDVDFSLTENAYSDSNIYKIAKATSTEMNLPVNQVLEQIGESVILTTKLKFNGFMDARGRTLKDYLLNLPNFHNRIMLIYPELTPPDFRISNNTGNSLLVHYISKTQGIREFIRGYLKGLMKIFDETATIEFIQSKNDGRQQEIFKISW
jgi:hypothetical protein